MQRSIPLNGLSIFSKRNLPEATAASVVLADFSAGRIPLSKLLIRRFYATGGANLPPDAGTLRQAFANPDPGLASLERPVRNHCSATLGRSGLRH
jgi:hypothetical protein